MTSIPVPTPLEPWFRDIKQTVDAHLEGFFRTKLERAARLSPPSVQMVEALRDFTMRGGKRTRPAMLIAGHAAIAPTSDVTPLLDACAGLELLQSYLLVHDDWMDQDDERRGGPAVHKLFEGSLGDPHLAASVAVLVGDLGNGFAIELVAGGPIPAEHRAAAMEVFWDMQQDVVWGQQLDLLAYPDVALIQRLKTGSYTVRGPLLLGAVLAGADPVQRRALEAYADPVGQAFQGQDDLLGVFGDPEKTGKPAGNDLRAGKRTALIVEAEARLAEADRAPITKVLGQSDASDADVKRAMELLESCGAREAVEVGVRGFLAQAEAALRGAPLREEGVLRLLQLVDKFVNRDH